MRDVGTERAHRRLKAREVIFLPRIPATDGVPRIFRSRRHRRPHLPHPLASLHREETPLVGSLDLALTIVFRSVHVGVSDDAMAHFRVAWRCRRVRTTSWRHVKTVRCSEGRFEGGGGSENPLPPFESEVGTPGTHRKSTWQDTTTSSDGVEADEEGADGWSRLEDQVRKDALTAPGTHYHFMGLEHDADNATIRSRYRQLSKLYHPDTAKSKDEDANQMFLKLQEAYSVLSSPQSRNIYDWKIYLDAVQTGAGYKRRLYHAARTYRADRTTSQNKYTNEDTLKRRERDPDKLVPLTEQAFAALLFDAFAIVVSLLTIGFVLLRESMGSLQQ